MIHPIKDYSPAPAPPNHPWDKYKNTLNLLITVCHFNFIHNSWIVNNQPQNLGSEQSSTYLGCTWIWPDLNLRIFTDNWRFHVLQPRIYDHSLELPSNLLSFPIVTFIPLSCLRDSHQSALLKWPHSCLIYMLIL